MVRTSIEDNRNVYRSTVFIINDSAHERDCKIRMPKKGGDICLLVLQMGMDVKYSETEKMKGGVPRRKR